MKKWSYLQLAQWVHDRQAGIQTTAETKVYKQPVLWTAKALHSKNKMFDAPYLLTMGKDFCRYQLLPVSISDHRVHLVYYYIQVNIEHPKTKLRSNYLHCVRCKLMGTYDTMYEYNCISS